MTHGMKSIIGYVLAFGIALAGVSMTAVMAPHLFTVESVVIVGVTAVMVMVFLIVLVMKTDMSK